jgi:carbonic anhydrase
MIENGEIGIIGGMHDLSTGQVTFYEDTQALS